MDGQSPTKCPAAWHSPAGRGWVQQHCRLIPEIGGWAIRAAVVTETLQDALLGEGRIPSPTNPKKPPSYQTIQSHRLLVGNLGQNSGAVKWKAWVKHVKWKCPWMFIDCIGRPRAHVNILIVVLEIVLGSDFQDSVSSKTGSSSCHGQLGRRF